MKEASMSKGFIRYKSEYKYQLVEKYEINISINPNSNIVTDYIDLDTAENLTVMKGYARDGPSGPVKDTHENMRASLVHDALYQLMRHDKLKSRTYRKTADRIFQTLCKEDGVSNLTAAMYYKALRKFGKPAASPENKKKIHHAPQGS